MKYIFRYCSYFLSHMSQTVVQIQTNDQNQRGNYIYETLLSITACAALVHYKTVVLIYLSVATCAI